MKHFLADTPTFRKITDAIDIAIARRRNALIAGPAGVGKSVAARAYCEAHHDVAMVEVDKARSSLMSVMRMTVTAFGGYTDRTDQYTLGERLDRMVWDRSQWGEALIVDEAQNLHADALRQLLSYQEWGRPVLPVIFVGNEHAIRKTREISNAFDQIGTRIPQSGRTRISGVVPGDIDAFCVEFNVEGKDAYDVARRFASGKSCREVIDLLNEAREQAGPVGSVRLDPLREAHLSCYGRAATRELFKVQTLDRTRRESAA